MKPGVSKTTWAIRFAGKWEVKNASSSPARSHGVSLAALPLVRPALAQQGPAYPRDRRLTRRQTSAPSSAKKKWAKFCPSSPSVLKLTAERLILETDPGTLEKARAARVAWHEPRTRLRGAGLFSVQRLEAACSSAFASTAQNFYLFQTFHNFFRALKLLTWLNLGMR